MIYNKINIMLPTYNRVGNGKLPRFVESIMKTASSLDNIVFSFLVNYNDQSTIDYIRGLKDLQRCILINKDINVPHLGSFYNKLYNQTTFKNDNYIVSMLGDDMVFNTKDSDLKIIDKVNKYNGIGVFYCNDGNLKNRMCVNIFTTRKFVNITTKPFMCEIFRAYFIDTVWFKLGQKTNTLHYLDDILIQHAHYTKTGEKDATSKNLDKVKMNFKAAYILVDNYVNSILPIVQRNLKNAVCNKF